MSSSIKPFLGSQLELGHPLAQGFVGLWLMNEGSGKMVADLSGNNLNGTFGGNTNWTSGKYGNAIDFPGVTDNITASTPSQIVDAITYVISFKLDVLQDNGLMRLEDTFVRIDSSGNFEWWPDIDTVVIDYAAGLSVGVWHTVAVTQDSSNNYAMYLDGVLVKSGSTVALDLVQVANDIVIGAFTTGGIWDLNGQISHIYIFNRALSSSEIALLYREPFCMFERNPIELWVGSVGAGAPAGNAGIMTTNTGYWGATF